MRSSSSSTVGLYGGGRVPPPHPFLRSSSVPEQQSIYDPFLEEDGLIPDYHPHHYPPGPSPAASAYRSGTPLGDPPGSSSYFDRASARNSYLGGGGGSGRLYGGGGRDGGRIGGSVVAGGQGGWRSSSSNYLDRGSRLTRLGRQFSVSSEIPTSDERTSSSYYPYHHRLYGAGGSAGDLPPRGGDSYRSSAAGLPGDYSSVVGHGSRNSPLTLGRSLQLVTSGSSIAGANPDAARRKKTVRFNSEEWGANGSSGPISGGGHHHHHNPYVDTCDDYDEELWMTVEDVRSGRWARWDALRQESQESQTRDSGIETGSCFTSSEDSNRGDHIHSKKVRWPAAEKEKRSSHYIAKRRS